MLPILHTHESASTVTFMKEIKNLKEMGLAIRSARRDADLTQAQLCAKARVSRRWLIALENGESEAPDASKILDTLRALGLVFAIGAPGQKPRPNQATLDALEAMEDFDD